MQEKLFSILFDEDEVTWQTMIYELVKSEEMDPWDIELATLSKKFLEMVKTLKKMDFRISGKIILAAAILLRIKSNKLLEEDLGNLNRLIAMSEADEDDLFEELEGFDDYDSEVDKDKMKLIPKTPQPRKRKVSVYDLVEALEKALEVKKRRVKFQATETKVRRPEKQVDISVLIKETFKLIQDYFRKENIKKLEFSRLLCSDKKEDKVYTFMPLLYLDNHRKIDLMQEKHLSEIDIYLKS